MQAYVTSGPESESATRIQREEYDSDYVTRGNENVILHYLTEHLDDWHIEQHGQGTR